MKKVITMMALAAVLIPVNANAQQKPKATKTAKTEKSCTKEEKKACSKEAKVGCCAKK